MPSCAPPIANARDMHAIACQQKQQNQCFGIHGHVSAQKKSLQFSGTIVNGCYNTAPHGAQRSIYRIQNPCSYTHWHPVTIFCSPNLHSSAVLFNMGSDLMRIVIICSSGLHESNPNSPQAVVCVPEPSEMFP